MDQVITQLLADNKANIRTQFEYLFIFIHVYIVDRFPQENSSVQGLRFRNSSNSIKYQ